MDMTHCENAHNLKVAESYYSAMLEKDFDKMAGYLHDNIHFIGPFAQMHRKDAVVLAAKNFGEMLKDVQIRSRFASQNQIMFAYDMVVCEPIGKFRAAVLMEFTDQLISKIELFYDSRLFLEKRDEIFESEKS